MPRVVAITCSVMESGGRRSPPSSPRRGEEVEEDGTAIDDWILASIEGWIRSSGRPQEDIVERIMTAFDMEELRKAATRLREGKWASQQFKVPDRGPADYSRQLATVVYKALLSIQDQGQPKVQFWVCAAEMHKVPGAAFVDNLDEVGVSARLGGVDGKLDAIMERLKDAESLKESVTDLARVVTGLQEQLKAQSVELQQVQAGGSYADRTRVTRPLLRVAQSGRNRSGSVKRGRDQAEEVEGNVAKQMKEAGDVEVHQALEMRHAHPAVQGSALSQDLQALRHEENGWQKPRKRRQGGIRKGSSAVQADGGISAPVLIFISGTNPNCTEEKVKEKLVECAAAIAKDPGQENVKELVVLKVEHIPIKIPQGEERRSRCWKVTLGPEFADHMARDEAYPAAWGWRKWNRGPRASQGTETTDVGA